MKRLFCIMPLAMLMSVIFLSCNQTPSNPVVAPLSQQNGVTSLAKAGCVGIQDGILKDSNGNTMTLGYDEFGYNYQAHMFNGTYDGVDRVFDGKYWGQTGDFVDDKLMMKWSDDWLSAQDCNHDGKLDRGDTGISKGWETNHAEGDYYDGNGNLQHYTYFVKIVWVGPGGSLWDQYEIIEEIYNDPAGGYHGPTFKPVAPGFGLNDHWTTH